MKLSELFGVSTDYLLKDEIEEADNGSGFGEAVYEDNYGEENERQRNVSLDEANDYMNLVQHAAKEIAAGVFLCILSPVPLIVMGGMAEQKNMGISEDMAGGLGVTVLLLLVAAAVAVFILNGMKLEKYEYMEKEVLSLQYGVAGIVEVKKEEFGPVFKICIAVGVVLCILSILPLLIGAAFQAPEMVIICCIGILLVIVAFAVFLFVWSGMIYGSYQKLLEEGDYTREKKVENQRNDNLAKVYWCTATAIYLGWSFLTGKWYITWVIWPCAGVLYAAVCGIAAMVRRK